MAWIDRLLFAWQLRRLRWQLAAGERSRTRDPEPPDPTTYFEKAPRARLEAAGFELGRTQGRADLEAALTRALGSGSPRDRRALARRLAALAQWAPPLEPTKAEGLSSSLYAMF